MLPQANPPQANPPQANPPQAEAKAKAKAKAKPLGLSREKLYHACRNAAINALIAKHRPEYEAIMDRAQKAAGLEPAQRKSNGGLAASILAKL